MPAPQMIPLDKIAPGENPRGEIDTASEAFKELCGSIEARGMLQSILVGPECDGKHPLIAGYRRHAAAAKLKLSEVPAMVVDADGAELTLALIENIQREDLTPVAEARAIRQLRDQHGLTQEKAAEALNKSVRWARERERLMGIPEKAQGAFDAGALPLESIGAVEKVAKQVPVVAEAIASAAVDDEGVRKAMASDQVPAVLDHLIVNAADEPNKDGSSKLGCLVAAARLNRRQRVTYEALVLAGAPHDQLKAVKDRLTEWKTLATKLKKLDTWAYPRDPDPMWVDNDDVDAAKTYGCLLELDDAAYFTDAAWLVDRFLQHVEAEVKQVEKQIAASKSSKKTEETEKGSPEEEKAAKEKRRKEREAEQRRRDEARANNLELGQRAERALRSPKLGLEEAKLLALMAIGRDADGLGGGGLIWCYHDYQHEEQLNNGRTKVTYANGHTAGEDLVSSVLAAKKPEEVFGIVLRALVLTEFADQECAAQSNRHPHSIRYGAADDCVDDLVQAIAVKRDVLPDEVRKAIERKAQVAAERAELHVLKAVSASRAKRGVSRADLTRGVLVTEAAIDQAVDSKHLKEHDGDEPSYTITAAGKKRLAKLKAPLKERQAS